MRTISHEKMTNLVKICVTMTDLMDKFYDTTELSDIICDECTKPSSTTRKFNCERKNSTEITNATKNISSNIQL